MTEEEHFTKFIEKHEAIRARLIQYYENQFAKIENYLQKTPQANGA